MLSFIFGRSAAANLLNRWLSCSVSGLAPESRGIAREADKEALHVTDAEINLPLGINQ
jgi:hypothetical protein